MYKFKFKMHCILKTSHEGKRDRGTATEQTES